MMAISDLNKENEFRLVTLYKTVVDLKANENVLIQNRMNWMLVATPIISAIYLAVLYVGVSVIISPISSIDVLPFMRLNIEIAIYFCIFISAVGGVISIMCLKAVNVGCHELTRLESLGVDLDARLRLYDDSYSVFSPILPNSESENIAYRYPRLICWVSILISFLGTILAIGMAYQFPDYHPKCVLSIASCSVQTSHASQRASAIPKIQPAQRLPKIDKP